MITPRRTRLVRVRDLPRLPSTRLSPLASRRQLASGSALFVVVPNDRRGETAAALDRSAAAATRDCGSSISSPATSSTIACTRAWSTRRRASRRTSATCSCRRPRARRRRELAADGSRLSAARRPRVGDASLLRSAAPAGAAGPAFRGAARGDAGAATPSSIAAPNGCSGRRGSWRRHFARYERRAAESGGCDEHMLRERLIVEPMSPPVGRTSSSRSPTGLPIRAACMSPISICWHACPEFESDRPRRDRRVLGSGFHQRIHDWLPGIEEIEWNASASRRARCCRVPAATPDRTCFTDRDREEELIGIARRLKADRREHTGPDWTQRRWTASPSSTGGRCRTCISRAESSAARAFPTRPRTRCRSPPSRLPPRSIWCSTSSRRRSRGTR